MTESANTDSASPRDTAQPRRGGRRPGMMIGLLVAVMLLVVGVAWAANIGLTQGTLGTGSVAADCQSATLTPSWTYAYDPTIPGYGITAVTLSGLDSGCLNKNVKVVLADSSGVSQITGSGTTPGSGTTATIPLSSTFSMGSTWISQIIVVIYS